VGALRVTEAVMVNAMEFWTLMCDPRFVRVSPLCGRIGADVYITLEAPEDIPGFIDQRIAGIKAVYAH
jgi:hypothetical protein